MTLLSPAIACFSTVDIMSMYWMVKSCSSSTPTALEMLSAGTFLTTCQPPLLLTSGVKCRLHVNSDPSIRSHSVGLTLPPWSVSCLISAESRYSLTPLC